MYQENTIELNTKEKLTTPSPLKKLLDNEELLFLDTNSPSTEVNLEKLLKASPNVKSNAKPKATNDEEYKIRIGSEFQADCPPMIPVEKQDLSALDEKALTIWIPNDDISDSSLQSYITLAHKKFGYNIEQALGMLYWHKFDIQAAIRDLDNFAPFPDEWTREDKIIFEDALLFHGKNFNRIRELLPDKTVGGVIDYYYMWKKRRGRQRLYDRRGRPRNEPKEQPVEKVIFD